MNHFSFLQEYLRQTGLSLLFPRVTSYLTNPERPAFQSHKSSMDGTGITFHTKVCFAVTVHWLNHLAQHNKQYHRKVNYLVCFLLNGFTLGFFYDKIYFCCNKNMYSQRKIKRIIAPSTILPRDSWLYSSFKSVDFIHRLKS